MGYNPNEASQPTWQRPSDRREWLERIVSRVRANTLVFGGCA